MTSPSFDHSLDKEDLPTRLARCVMPTSNRSELGQARSKRIWAALGIAIALGLLLAFYGVVTTVAKRAEQQKAQDTRQAQVFWRCIELPDAEQRRACHERNATSADRPAQAQPGADSGRFANTQELTPALMRPIAPSR